MILVVGEVGVRGGPGGVETKGAQVEVVVVKDVVGLVMGEVVLELEVVGIWTGLAEVEKGGEETEVMECWEEEREEKGKEAKGRGAREGKEKEDSGMEGTGRGEKGKEDLGMAVGVEEGEKGKEGGLEMVGLGLEAVHCWGTW